MLKTEKRFLITQPNTVSEKKFLSYVSHRIRTPLNSVIGFSKLLLNKDCSDEKVEDFADKILSSGYEILHYFQNIMDLSEMETDIVNVNPVKLDAKDLILRLVREYRDRFQPEHNIEIKCTDIRNFRSIPIQSDDYIFSRILGNIIELTRMMIHEGEIILSCIISHDGYIHFRVTGKFNSVLHAADESLILQKGEDNDSIEYLTYKVIRNFSELLGGTFSAAIIADNEILFNFILPYHSAIE